MINNFDEIFTTDEGKSVGSMFLNYYSENIKDIDVSKFDHWKNYMIEVDNDFIKMEKLINTTNELTLIYNSEELKNSRESKNIYKLIDDRLSISYNHLNSSYHFTDFFLFKIKENFKSIKSTSNEITRENEIVFSKSEQGNPIPNISIVDLIKQLKNGYVYSARAIIPCLDEFFALRINEESKIPYVHHYNFNRTIYFPYPKMLSPYIKNQLDNYESILKLEINDKLIDWVYENRYDKKTTKEDIVKSYKDFCNEIDLEEINKLEFNP